MRTALLIGLVALVFTAGAAAAAQPDPAVWNAILAARARDGGFDYRGTTGQDRKRLSAYLANLGDADPKAMGRDECKAFLINAYNAMAVAIVLDRYPVKSILDVDGAFKSVRRRIGGEMLTLDDVENRLRDFTDARIHFAIVCASKSCPPLAAKAYTAAGLSAALDAQGRAFVSRSLEERARPGRDRAWRSRRSSSGTARSSSATAGTLVEVRRRGSCPSRRWRVGSRRFRASPNSSSTTGP